jgi:hypothetical protein
MADRLLMVRKSELNPGDAVIVKTRNSVYTIRVLTGDACRVSGGWFDQKGLGPIMTSIRGCTWGGSIIKVDIVAALGLCIEFGNRVTTSQVRSIVLLPRAACN